MATAAPPLVAPWPARAIRASLNDLGYPGLIMALKDTSSPRGCLGETAGPRPRPTQADSGGARPGGRLPHGGEGRGDQQLVFLPDRPHPRLGRPRAAGLARGLTDAGALVEILVDPDMDELVQPAELVRPAGRQGGEFLPRRNGCAPRLQHLR